MASKSEVQRKADELNALAGSKRFTVIDTPLMTARSSTLRDSYSIHDTKTGKNYAYGSIAGMAGLASLTNELKKQSAGAGYLGKKLKHAEEVDAFLTGVEGMRVDDLQHYGVLGMKWGVRKDPDKAYSRSVSKLKKLDAKSASAKIAAAKSDAKSAQKYEQKSAKYSAKAAKVSEKAAKVGTKDSKLETKARKLRMKASKSWTEKGYERKIKKAEKLEYKSAKKEYESSKLTQKAAKYTKKAEQAALKASKLNAGSAGKTLQSLKYEKKAKSWANEMNKAFANTNVNSLSASDIQVGEAYGVTFINEYMKRAG